jgi:CRISPR-associated protein Cas2
MKSWYIIAYDIREAKRLRRLHYYLCKRAISLQNSVFLVKISEQYLQQLSSALQSIANETEDDIRIYPVHHPDTIWAAGRQVDALQYLYIGKGKQRKQPKKAGWLRVLIGWK